MKKRIMLLLLCVVMIVPTTACKKNPNSNDSSDDSSFSSEYIEPSSQESNNVSSTESTNSSSNKSESSKSNTVKSNVDPKAPKKKYDRGVSIAEGKVTVENGVNFGGKTFKMAVFNTANYKGSDFKNMVSAFEKKYNCKIKLDILDFANYTRQVSAKLSGGSPYDIAYMHGSMFPSAVIAKLYIPLDEYFSTADVYNGNGGFDMSKSTSFAWNNRLYGVAGVESVNPYVIFYNKKMIKDNDLPDPRKMYENGKWTWEALKQLGAQATDSANGIYLGSSEFMVKAFELANDGKYVTYENGKAKENITSPNIVNALKFIQEICSGNNRIVAPNGEPGDVAMNPTDFYNGKTYMHIQEDDHLQSIAPNIQKSNAFGRSLENLGIVPIPLGPDNKSKSYPTGWIEAVCACKGTSDPRAALVWAKFTTTYKRQASAYSYSADDQKLLDSLTKGNINHPDYSWSNSSESVDTIVFSIEKAVGFSGRDISQTLNDYRSRVANCIETTYAQK